MDAMYIDHNQCVHIIIYKLSQEVIMERWSKIAEWFDLNREKIYISSRRYRRSI